MSGMDASTGRALDGMDHLIQSIRDILTTPIGTRVMRREYGSTLFDLMDRPVTPGLLIEIYASVAQALDKWEPRFRLTEIRASSATAGWLSLDLTGEYRPAGQVITLEGVVV